MRKYLPHILIISFVFLLAPTAQVASYAGDAKTAQQIAKQAFRSTVLLVMEDDNGQPLSFGSGFFVDNGKIATNLHVIEGASRGYAKVLGLKSKYNIEGIVAIDRNRDLALLAIEASQTPSLILGKSEAVEVGEQIYVIGNPQGLEGTFSQGIISSIREIGTDKLLQITAPISPGSSGGPVLNNNGEVIGVSVATFTNGQNLNFAIPSNYLSDLQANTGKLKPLVTAKSSKKDQSLLAGLGRQSTEGVIGVQLTWDYLYMQSGGYSFSLRNKLRENVRNVHCLVIFYDSHGSPIDVDVVQYRGVIRAGLASRVTSSVDSSVQTLTTNQGSLRPQTKVELRILDFQVVR